MQRLIYRRLHSCTTTLARVKIALDLHHFCTIALSLIFIDKYRFAAICAVLHSLPFSRVKVGANLMLFFVRLFALVFERVKPAC